MEEDIFCPFCGSSSVLYLYFKDSYTVIYECLYCKETFEEDLLNER